MTATTAPGIFTESQWQQVQQLLRGLDSRQTLWLSGFLAGHRAETASTAAAAASAAKILVAFGSETGNGESLARQLASRAADAGIAVELCNLATLRLRQLARHSRLLLICSTHGDGDPPEPITTFYDSLMRADATPLPQLEYAVLALGDSSYEHFCATGRELDERLAALGATRLLPRCECDVDFAVPARTWMQELLSRLSADSIGITRAATPVPTPASASTGDTRRYSRQSPLEVEVLGNVRLSDAGRRDAVHHLDLALDASDFPVAPGDAVGVLVDNPPALVAALLKATGLSGEQSVRQDDKAMSLVQALRQECNLTIPGKRFLEIWAELSGSAELRAIVADNSGLREFLRQWQILDIVTRWPAHPEAQQLLDGLRPLQPRLYDVANSLRHIADELHLTVRCYRYAFRNREETGIASDYLLQLQPGDRLRVYPHRNARFHLPQETQAPLVLIAEGTGIAPYRAFIQDILAGDRQHRCWLYFAEQRFREDFLYQLDWQAARQRGVLERLSTAFSHDAPGCSLPDALGSDAERLRAWLDDGAHFYFCGDKALMEQCEHTLQTHPALAAAWDALARDKRLHRNLY